MADKTTLNIDKDVHKILKAICLAISTENISELIILLLANAGLVSHDEFKDELADSVGFKAFLEHVVYYKEHNKIDPALANLINRNLIKVNKRKKK